MPFLRLRFETGNLGMSQLGQGSWDRQFGKAVLDLAFEVWVRAHGQATGCVTRQFETGNFGNRPFGQGSLGQAVWNGSFALGVGSLGKGTQPGNWVCHQAV